MGPLQFRLDYALSREQTNKSGGKMYIQDKVEEYSDEVFDLLDNGAHIFFCGLKGMMPGATPVLPTLPPPQYAPQGFWLPCSWDFKSLPPMAASWLGEACHQASNPISGQQLSQLTHSASHTYLCPVLQQQRDPLFLVHSVVLGSSSSSSPSPYA